MRRSKTEIGQLHKHFGIGKNGLAARCCPSLAGQNLIHLDHSGGHEGHQLAAQEGPQSRRIR